ncbi:MAG TPA: hypothetical protein ENJ99_02770 [Rhizobiales bacterium]|nr:hypothetical protein [Hyphomicrobiales bacterium]
MIRNIIPDWTSGDSKVFEKDNFYRKHTLAKRIDVSDEGLAALIDATPADMIDVVTMGADKTDNASWRTGDVRGVSGADAIKAVKTGRVWLNLKNLDKIMPEYRELLKEIYDGFEAAVPGLKVRHPEIGFIISSPGVQTFYHADVPITILWQMRGVKRVYAWPLEEKFLSREMLEGIYLNEYDEVDIPFKPEFDDEAMVVDLQPGEVLTWPHNAPHRVQNLDMVNVSLSTEHFTLDTMKRYGVYFTNGYLNRRFGIGPLSTGIDGPSAWLKSAFAMGLKKTGIQKQHRRVKMVSFRVDPDAPNGVRDIEPYPHGDFNTSADAVIQPAKAPVSAA